MYALFVLSKSNLDHSNWLCYICTFLQQYNSFCQTHHLKNTNWTLILELRLVVFVNEIATACRCSPSNYNSVRNFLLRLVFSISNQTGLLRITQYGISVFIPVQSDRKPNRRQGYMSKTCLCKNI